MVLAIESHTISAYRTLEKDTSIQYTIKIWAQHILFLKGVTLNTISEHWK